jgi:cytochrome c-type biogenesis protein CcmH/NrfG
VRPRTLVAVLVTALAVYLVLVAWRGVVLVVEGTRVGDAVSVVLGLSVLVFPVLGAALVWREVQFGRDTEALARSLAARQALPDDLAFDPAHAHAAQHPDDPAAWYRLGLAYDDMGDRRQARACVRRAVALWRSAGADGA